MMTHPAVNTRALPATFRDALTQALSAERRLIDELTQVILRQREAVGLDDLSSVNDSVFATHRLLIALGEVRKRRRSLNRLFGYGDEGGGRDGATTVSRMPDEFRAAHEGLRQAAQRLSIEIGVNRRLLRRALETSEAWAHAVH